MAGDQTSATRLADAGAFAELSRRPELVLGLLEHAHEGLTIVDSQGKCVWVNRVLCEMTGFSSAELLAAPPYPYWPLEELETIREVWARVEQSEPTPAELSLQRKSGERFPALLRSTRVRDERGQTLASLHTIIDLSTTRRAAAEHTASEQRWRSIAENPYDFVSIIGRDYKYQFVNKLTPGLRFEDLIGVATPFDFLPPEDHERVRQYFEDTFRTGRPKFYEVWLPKYDVWYANLVCAVESDGEIRELSVLSRDITEAKRTERAQRRSEQRLAIALASVQDGLVELDLRTGSHAYSARTYELLGFADGDPELSTQVDGLLARVHPEDALLFARGLQAALEDGADFNQEFRIRAREGSYRWFHARGRTVEDEGKRFLAFLTDVTHRYEAEEQRRALAAELQQAQRLETIGTLAGGIAHDFNNLLTPIMGALELAQLALPTGHSARSVLDDARRAAQRAKSLTGQILTFARRGQLRFDPVDLVQLVREELRLQSGTSGVQLLTELPADIPMVLGDRTQLQQIVANLLANALHAMRGMSGRLLLKVDHLRIESTDADDAAHLSPGDYARLTVTDEGMGIPEPVQRRVFEPFFTTKPLGQGTGLGLAVVHGVVMRHGGHLRLHSEPGRGTTFEVYLPTSAGPDKRSSEPPPIGPGRAGPRRHVVCVDDEAAVLSVMKRALEMANYHVSAATSPNEALEWFRTAATRIDLLVTDYRMPQLSGLELAQHARALRPDMPVILVTGHAEGLPASGNPAGIYAVIRKPFRLSELVHCVDACLAAQAPERSASLPVSS